ncbi:Adenosylmethionine-8-amino-7-oxononanoate aminotransferase (BioA) (PDB:1MLY) [Commensalibacter communis]|uniref:Adenosylmethionine-8-amino-7-oxononanoate aminotransferase n=2 Tax=Commensalibacter communis TaxID=2972786 RepID=A0A9W4X6G0_9PROT|nr:Adenosylmethionine-8-amino-7-oxononanoate aminotransferase (BioA) (PDB:1MLY) [Commensalibacter communis]CAI3927283.1 Adenosylmethionine-8-amino-7-oxononanoate aminotransferase (BioA) (PDB:1MLY) [Commensalibacter communis]CAI3934169.1 Adenosylmethionine-8-amino-7-oxononanoate aminotransferase (BioA) (PDB:1MLY) [Commensalibacter communis]CAI3935750.1 Adenosylmethionine-8-amino-7-oxononanoate aminotransferase (BioA) (PDB:1MLY) [Commensalibacter communis]
MKISLILTFNLSLLYAKKMSGSMLKNIWLPYTQMQTCNNPVIAENTKGSVITLQDGTELIDGIASWWTACHGYNHPYIANHVQQQLRKMPHIMFGGMVHKPAINLSAKLAELLPGDLNKVFFTESGSVAVEVAMKMAIQFWLNQNKMAKTKILSFYGGYHGDTMATMAVCDPEEGMHHLFKDVLPHQHIIALPTTKELQQQFSHFLENHHQETAAMLIEPLVQGAGGMLFHDPEILLFLRQQADHYNVLLIFDEIFTGLGRTGSLFSCNQADIVPDIITLSKALSGGTMALAATIARERIFSGFLSDKESHALMHGPTFMANPLACSCANASLDLFNQYDWKNNVKKIEAQLSEELSICRQLEVVKDVRVKGAIGVVELYKIENMNLLKKQLLQHKVWIRPFRNILYLTPSFTITTAELSQLTRAIYEVLIQL